MKVISYIYAELLVVTINMEATKILFKDMGGRLMSHCENCNFELESEASVCKICGHMQSWKNDLSVQKDSICDEKSLESELEIHQEKDLDSINNSYVITPPDFILEDIPNNLCLENDEMHDIVDENSNCGTESDFQGEKDIINQGISHEQTLDNDVLTDINPKSESGFKAIISLTRTPKGKKVSLIVGLILMVFIGLLASGVLSDTYRLKSYAASGKITNITDYIQQNYARPKDEQAILLAVSLIFDVNDENGIRFLETFLLSSKEIPQSIESLIINSFHSVNLFMPSVNSDITYLTKYIEANYLNSNNSKIVYEIVSQITKSENLEALRYLENLFLNKSDCPKDLKAFILSSFNQKSINFGSLESLVSYYTEKLSSSKDSESEQVLLMLQRYDSKLVHEKFINCMYQKYIADDYIGVMELIYKYELMNIQLQEIDKVKIIKEQLKSLREQDNNIAQIKKEIEELNDDIYATQQYINENSYISLKAYMISQLEPNVYEIALPESSYWGDVPSGTRRAILKTVNTSYASKGWLFIDVRYLGEETVTLKEEYGSFAQQWPIYVEVSMSEKEYLLQNKDSLTSNRKELSEKNNQIDTIAKNIKSTKKDIDGFFKSQNAKIIVSESKESSKSDDKADQIAISMLKPLSRQYSNDNLKAHYCINDIDKDNVQEIIIFEQNMDPTRFDNTENNAIAIYKLDENSYEFYTKVDVEGSNCIALSVGKIDNDSYAIFIESYEGAHAGYVQLIAYKNGKLLPQESIYSLYPVGTKDIDNDGILEIGSMEIDPNSEDQSNAGSDKIIQWYKWSHDKGFYIVHTEYQKENSTPTL